MPFHVSQNALFSRALNISRDGTSTASLGTLVMKNAFLIANLNLLSFSLNLFPLVLSLRVPCEKSLSRPLVGPLKVVKGHDKVSLQPSLLAEQAEMLIGAFVAIVLFCFSATFL